MPEVPQPADCYSSEVLQPPLVKYHNQNYNKKANRFFFWVSHAVLTLKMTAW